MALSGLDGILRECAGDTSFVHAGYSAGACVLAPTLRGIHLAAEPEVVPDGYTGDVPWGGLGLIPVYIAPHHRSDHPDSPRILLGDSVDRRGAGCPASTVRQDPDRAGSALDPFSDPD